MSTCKLTRCLVSLGFLLQTAFYTASPGVFFFWTHFRLSRWMATHLRMRSATPSVYFDDLEKGVLTMIEQNDCQEDCGCKSYSSGDFKQEGTSAYNYNVHACSEL